MATPFPSSLMSTITTDFASPVPASAPWRVAGPGTVGAWRCFIVRADGFLARVELLLLVTAAAAGWTARGALGVGATPMLAGLALLLVASAMLMAAEVRPLWLECASSTMMATLRSRCSFPSSSRMNGNFWTVEMMIFFPPSMNLRRSSEWSA